MMVRRYVVKDMPEAVLLIRKDLGKDAVILSTKRIKLKKWLGIVRYKRIEVVAAAGDDIPLRGTLSQLQNEAREATQESISSGEIAVTVPAADDLILNTVSGYRAYQTSAIIPSKQAEDLASDVLGSTRFENDIIDGTLTSTKPDVGASIPYFTITDREEIRDPQIQRLWKEMADMKRLLENALHTQSNVWSSFVGHLSTQGIRKELIWALLDNQTYVRDELDVFDDSLEGRKQELEKLLLQTLASVRNPQPISDSSKVVAFVGPTGVGKTTTVAKLAALHVLTGNKKVGLITADTFRIAAIEQLKTYATILNIPLAVIQNPEDVKPALQSMSECDLILIDTAGRSFREDIQVAEIKLLLSELPVDETFLVLSATSKPEDMEYIARRFDSVPIDKLLFTKLDETSTYGAIFNLLLCYQKPISYVTTGQNVPDDIEVASLEKLLKVVLEGVA